MVGDEVDGMIVGRTTMVPSVLLGNSFSDDTAVEFYSWTCSAMIDDVLRRRCSCMALDELKR